MDENLYNLADVTVIPTIGPAEAEFLAAIEIHCLPDLLRIAPSQMQQALPAPDRVSLPQLRTWRQIALLLEVGEMTPEWAETLHHKGIQTVDALSRTRQTHLEEIFAEAEEKKQIAKAPTIDQCSALIRDAAILQHTSWIGGRVLAPDDTAVEAAEIRLGNSSARSGRGGSFRLSRINAAVSAPLHIHHPMQGAITLPKPALITDNQAFAYPSYRLEPH